LILSVFLSTFNQALIPVGKIILFFTCPKENLYSDGIPSVWIFRACCGF